VGDHDQRAHAVSATTVRGFTVTALTGRRNVCRDAGQETGVICDACGIEWMGGQHEALDVGWTIRGLRSGRSFVMCGDCESHFALVWALREQMASGRTTPSPRRRR
jgi:hypothetical protein